MSEHQVYPSKVVNDRRTACASRLPPESEGTTRASAATGGATTAVSAVILQAVWAALESIMCF